MRYEVESSSIKVIEETGRGTMIVTFRSGDRYEYFDVAHSVVLELVQAESIGRYFNQHIRGQYREERRS